MSFLDPLIGDFVIYFPVTVSIMSDHIIDHPIEKERSAINNDIERTDGTGTVLGKPECVVTLSIMNHSQERLNPVLLTKPVNQTCVVLSFSNCRKA